VRVPGTGSLQKGGGRAVKNCRAAASTRRDQILGCNNSGTLAIFAAILRASSRVRGLAPNE
jgi:hypothetical protein